MDIGAFFLQFRRLPLFSGDIGLVLLLQKGINQRHTHQLPVKSLLEIAGAGILVHRHFNLVHSGQWVQNDHIVLGLPHLLFRQDIYILQALVFLQVSKPFLLNSGHIQHIQLSDLLFQRGAFLVIFFGQIAFLHEFRQRQLLGRNQHKTDTLVS